MPVPKRKTSKARRNKRSAGQRKIRGNVVIKCPTCDAPLLPHQVCKECGYYKGVKVLRTKLDRLYERNESRKAKQVANNQAVNENNNEANSKTVSA